jgi:DNA-binding transcriptional LysR family regulator
LDLRGINLNLLAAFDALLRERSVTRAARRMGVTQSAMSGSLAQLRELFDDQLFRRAAHGIEPTPRALALAQPIHAGLTMLQQALTPSAFDARVSQRRFVLAASDYVEFVLMPPLLARLSREAPSVRIEVRPWGLHEVPSLLARGEADLMVGFYDELPAHHAQQLLFDEEYTCIVRKRHPRIRRKPTLEAWLKESHVLVSQRGDSPGSVDRALAARKLQRTVAARVSHFLMVPVLVARTDLVAALSARVVAAFAVPLGLFTFAPPIVLPAGRVGQVWHEQMERDDGHRWLRELIADVSREL